MFFTQKLCQFCSSFAAVRRIRRTEGLSSTAESLRCPTRRHGVSRHTRGDLRQNTPALHNTSTRTPTYNTQGWSTLSYLVGFRRSFSALGWPAHVVYQIWSGLLFDFSSMFMFTQHCRLLIVVLCSTISGDYSFLAVCGVDQYIRPGPKQARPNQVSGDCRITFQRRLFEFLTSKIVLPSLKNECDYECILFFLLLLMFNKYSV